MTPGVSEIGQIGRLFLIFFPQQFKTFDPFRLPMVEVFQLGLRQNL